MDIAIRAVVLYAFLVFLMRVIGRRELSSLSGLDLILLLFAEILGKMPQNRSGIAGSARREQYPTPCWCSSLAVRESPKGTSSGHGGLRLFCRYQAG